MDHQHIWKDTEGSYLLMELYENPKKKKGTKQNDFTADLILHIRKQILPLKCF